MLIDKEVIAITVIEEKLRIVQQAVECLSFRMKEVSPDASDVSPKDDPPGSSNPDKNPDKGAAGTKPSQDGIKKTAPKKELSPNNYSNKDPRLVTVKRRKDGCRIGDVANALGNFAPHTIKTWIEQKKVKAKEATEGGQITWYLDPDSLREFLEEHNIFVTFNGITGIKMPK